MLKKKNPKVAKVLQNLASGHLFGVNEYFMEPMNVFLKATQQQFGEYLMNLVTVPEPEDYLVRRSE